MTILSKGVIEVSADASKLKAGIDDAKRSIKGLGKAAQDENSKSSQSIDRYIKRLEVQNATIGKSVREVALYQLSLRGASQAQLAAADATLKLSEAHHRTMAIGAGLKVGFIAVASAAATLGVAMLSASAQAIDGFNDLRDATGASIENISALDAVARRTGAGFATVQTALIKFNAALKDSDPNSGAALALKAIGLNAAELRKIDPAEALRQTAVALSQFADDGNKARLTQELLGKSLREVAPFLVDLAAQGRLVATTTTQQAEEVEKFRKSLFALQANVADLARSLTSDLVPALNTFFDKARRIGAAGGIFGSIASEVEANLLSDRLNTVVAKIERFDEFVKKNPNSNAKIRLAELREEYRLLQAQVAKSSDALKTFAGALDPRPDSFDVLESRRLGRVKPSIEPPKPKPVKVPVNNDAAQIAKAQLQFDLDQIRKASDVVTSTFANSERIMEARRASALLDEREYYAAKLGFLRLNAQEQQAAQTKEIARLEAEKLTGKDRIDNERKIADAQAKMMTIRESAAASIEVLRQQETSALQAVAQAYRDAEDAAQSYLDQIRKGQARELSGAGLGDRERGRIDGRAQIEDKFSEQRRDLERSRRDAEFTGTFGPQAQKRYEDELDRLRRFQATELQEYDAHYTKRAQQDGDWRTGANKALASYYEEAADVATQSRQLFDKAFRGMEDALVDFVTKGKLNFGSLADSIIADLVRITIKQSILGPLEGVLKGGAGGNDFARFVGRLFSAKGNAFDRAGVTPFASGGIVNAATPFVYGGNRLGVMGEAGPEAIVPLRRGPDGSLGVASHGAAPSVTINVAAGPTRNEVMNAIQLTMQVLRSETDQKLRRAGVT